MRDQNLLAIFIPCHKECPLLKARNSMAARGLLVNPSTDLQEYTRSLFYCSTGSKALKRKSLKKGEGHLPFRVASYI